MVALRLFLDGTQAGETLKRNTSRAGKKVLAATRGTAEQTRSRILERGSADIGSAGTFGSRWTAGLKAKVTEGGGNIKISVTHDQPGFWIHEKGGIIKGKPLLWIPLSSSGIKNVNARDYPNRLVRVNRKSGGVPLLLSLVDRKPKYFGVPSVTMRKRFHITEIVAEEAKKMKDTYKAQYAAAKDVG